MGAVVGGTVAGAGVAGLGVDGPVAVVDVATCAVAGDGGVGAVVVVVADAGAAGAGRRCALLDDIGLRRSRRVGGAERERVVHPHGLVLDAGNSIWRSTSAMHCATVSSKPVAVASVTSPSGEIVKLVEIRPCSDGRPSSSFS